MNKKIIDRYFKVAHALKPKLQNGRSFHVTCIFEKSKILSIGVNDYSKEHRRHKFGEYKPTKGGSSYIAAIHSESSAIIKLGEENCSRYIFVNFRVDNNGKMANCKPCQNCFSLLNQVGFKDVWYFESGCYRNLSGERVINY